VKQKILVTREVFDEVLVFLRQHFQVEGNQQDTVWPVSELLHRLADKDGALVTIADPIDRTVIEYCPQLRAISTIAAGYNNIDVAACTQHGIVVTNTPGVLEQTTADHAWALMLAAARRIVHADRWVRAGEWYGWRFKDWLGLDVYGKTLGIVGMGGVGQAVARRASGFDMRVLYHNRSRLTVEVETRCAATHVGLVELLREADFVVLTVPYGPQTHHLIGARELDIMKSTAVLVNMARGGVVDDEALIEALSEGRIAAAGLDVFEREPALNPGFLGLHNVTLTPHIGSASYATRMNMAMLAARNLVAALTGGTPPNPVNSVA
jgi:gluconate 2-dehydrogenase